MSVHDHHVVILGASGKPARFANQAQRLLMDHGYRVTPVTPRFGEVHGVPTVARVSQIDEPVDTLTLYLGPSNLVAEIDALMALRPGRVIFNPGTECIPYQQRLDSAGIDWVEACTLVMLRTGRF